MSGSQKPEETWPLPDSSEASPTLPRTDPASPESERETTLGQPPWGDSDDSLAVPRTGQTLLNRYTVLSQLGEGGMGVVLSVYDARLDRRVALKLLRLRDISASGVPDAQSLFLREAQAMARLNHPNVVAVYDAGTLENGSLFIAMELVEGETLRRWQKRRPWREVLDTYLAAGRGLAAAHAAGLVHRDFKPDNVLVGQDGRVRVTDFGLARLDPSLITEEIEQPESISSLRSSRALETPLTRPSTWGTPLYMAPEQLHGARGDARSDLYAFCTSLYEGLYKRRPYQGDSITELRRAHREGVSPPANSEVPTWLARTVLQGLHADPDQRPASMAALLAELGSDPGEKRRAWVRRASVAGVTLALAVLAVWGWGRQQGQMCSGLDQRLAGVWDAAVRAKVEQALRATNLSYAPDTAARVTAELDKYAGAWVKQRTELCLSTSREGSTRAQGLVVLEESCLERRRSQLHALTGLLSQGPDPELVSRAVSAALALPPLDYCSDIKVLTASVPPPEQPEVRAKVEALQEQVDRLDALFDGGKYKEGVAQAEQLLPQVEAVGYGPLHSRALFSAALLKDAAGDFKGAEASLRQAITEAARVKDLFYWARASAALISVVGDSQGRHADALLLHPMVENLVEAVDDDRLRSVLLNFQGNVFSAMSRFDEARQAFERARALRVKLAGSEGLEIAASDNNLSYVFLRQGQPTRAYETLMRSLAMREKILGPEHPQVGASLSNLGLLLWGMGRFEESYQTLLRALALEEKLLGPEHPVVSDAITNLGYALSGLGRYEEARQLFTRALAIREKALGPEHPSTASSLGDLGGIQESLGKYEEARSLLERSLALQEKVLGPTHAEVAPTLSALGSVLRHQGKLAQAREKYARALALHEKTEGATSPSVAEPLMGLSQLLVDQHKPDEALPLIERAMKVVPENNRANGQFLLAQALWDADRDRAHAVELATQAHATWERLGRKNDTAEVSRWLAEHKPRAKPAAPPPRKKKRTRR